MTTLIHAYEHLCNLTTEPNESVQLRNDGLNVRVHLYVHVQLNTSQG